MNLAQKWKEFVGSLNEKGIPLPTARDPQTQKGSVTFTLVAVSFGLMALSTGLCVGLIISKWAGFFEDTKDSLTALKEAFSMAFQMSSLSAGLYWGRKFQKDDKGGVTLDK